MVRRRRCEQIGVGPRTGVQPTKATLAALAAAQTQDISVGCDEPLTHVHLAVVGGEQQHGAWRQRRLQVGDQLIHGAQFSIVERPETALVSNLVDAVVVRVHEPIATTQEVADDHGQAGGNAPPDRFAAS